MCPSLPHLRSLPIDRHLYQLNIGRVFSRHSDTVVVSGRHKGALEDCKLKATDRIVKKKATALQFDTPEPLDTLPDIVDVMEADLNPLTGRDKQLLDLMDTREGKSP